MIDSAQFLKKFVTSPISTVYRKCLSPTAMGKLLQWCSGKVYKHSQDPSYVMIAFNAIAIFSSHLAQKKGLKKSNRENKEYLIQQENVELFVDAALSILPSVGIKKYVEKKILTGAWTTASQRKKMIVDLPPVIGAAPDDIYETFKRTPIKQKCKDVFNKVKFKIATNKYIPKNIREKISFERIKPKGRKFGEITNEALERFDKAWQNNAPNMRNGSAMADIGGFRNGLVLMATLSYSILAATVLMPILKNIFTNYSYKKQLAAIGETPENVRRKKRYAFNENPVYNTNSAVFSEMSASLGRSKNTIYHQNLKNVAASSKYHKHPSVFSDIAKMNTSSLRV